LEEFLNSPVIADDEAADSFLPYDNAQQALEGAEDLEQHQLLVRFIVPAEATHGHSPSGAFDSSGEAAVSFRMTKVQYASKTTHIIMSAAVAEGRRADSRELPGSTARRRTAGSGGAEELGGMSAAVAGKLSRSGLKSQTK
jgi:hypothetical protein